MDIHMAVAMDIHMADMDIPTVNIPTVVIDIRTGTLINMHQSNLWS